MRGWKSLLALGLALLVGCAAESDGVEAVEGAETVEEVGEVSEALSSCACSLPTSGLYATFKVGNESFDQQITDPNAIKDAIALWRGQSNKRVPSGALSCSCSGWNCNWNFSMQPQTVRFSSSAIELCDGTPSYVNANCRTFGNGSYCPWTAQLTNLRDCRMNRSCPVVSR